MRRVPLQREDFAMFHQDITPHDYEYFRNHSGAFKRMWHEQTRRFWSVFVSTFDHFIWNYGAMKDFPIKIEDLKTHIDEIMFFLQHQFVEGTATTAKNLIGECVTVAQNRHYISMLDKASYSQNPFYMKETRETFRKFFGQPNAKNTFVNVLCGLPVYLKFAGAVVEVLKRWLQCEDTIRDDYEKESYFAQIHRTRCEDTRSLQTIHRAVERELKKEAAGETEKKVTKTEFARRATRQKALEWIGSTDTTEDFDDLVEEEEVKIGYKKKCKQAIRSATVDVHESMIKTLADAKMREIEEAQERGEDIQPILDGLGISKDKKKRKKKRRKKKKGKPEPEEEEEEEKDVVLEEPESMLCSEDWNKAMKHVATVIDNPVALNHVLKEAVIDDLNCVESTPPPAESPAASPAKSPAASPAKSPAASPEPKQEELPLEEIDCTAKEPVVAVMSETVSIQSLTDNIATMSTNKSDRRFASTMKAATQTLPPEIANMNLAGDGESTLVMVLGNSKLENDAEYAELLKKGCSAVVSSTSVKTEDLEELLKTTKSYEELADAVEKKGVSQSIVMNVPPKPDAEVPGKKLHTCGYCGVKEEVVKSFKRCQRCRGKPDPKYYCSKKCQTEDWKTGHKLIHRDGKVI